MSKENEDEQGYGELVNIGSLFLNFNVSESEKERITKLLATDGTTPRDLLKRYIPRTRLYREVFQRKERIPGFRPGTSLYHEQASKRIINYLADNSAAPLHQMAWDIYKNATADFVIAELSNLNRLFLTIHCPSNTPHDSNQLLKLICINAFDFEVKEADLKKFYEIIWLDRIDSFEAYLSFCSDPTPSQLNSHKLKDLAGDIYELKQQLDSLVNNTTHDSSLNELKQQVSDLDVLIEALSDDFTKQLSKQLEIQQAEIKNIYSLLSTLTNEVNALSEDTIRQSNVSALSARIEEAMSQRDRTFQSVVESIEDNLTEKLSILESGFESLRNGMIIPTPLKQDNQVSTLSTNYKSPLQSHQLEGPDSFEVMDDPSFIGSWVTHLAESYNVNVEYAIAAAVHGIILSNKAIVCDLVTSKSWIECMRWSAHSKHLVASPLWTSEQDWSDAAFFLFSEHELKAPRIVTIHNFNIGLVDCYLVPSLLLWSIQTDALNLKKLFLIPSSRKDQDESAQLLEHVASVGSFGLFDNQSVSLTDDFSEPPPVYHYPAMGVSPDHVLKWISTTTEFTSKIYIDIMDQFDLEFSPWLIQRFSHTESFLTKYLTTTSATDMAASVHLLPWIRSVYGIEVYLEVIEYMKSKLENRG